MGRDIINCLNCGKETSNKKYCCKGCVIIYRKGKPTNKPPWNKGLTKYNNEIIRRCANNYIGFKHSEETRKKFKILRKRYYDAGNTVWNKGLSGYTVKKGYRPTEETKMLISIRTREGMNKKEIRDKLSAKAIQGYADGTRKLYTPKYKAIKYNNINYRSSWEKYFAWLCDQFYIFFEYEKHRFTLDIDGVKTTYVPDFYINKYDLYVEIKGICNNFSLNKIKKFAETNKIIVIERSIFNKIIKNNPNINLILKDLSINYADYKRNIIDNMYIHKSERRIKLKTNVYIN